MDHESIDRRQFFETVGAGALAAGLAFSGLPLWGDDASAEDPLYSFLAVADPHLGENRGGLTGVEKFQLVIEKAATLSPQPDFMLLLGDVHPGSLEPMLGDIGLPIHAIAGNHETTEARQQLREMFPDDFHGKDFYSFEHKDSLFIGLCDALVGDHVGHFDSEDITPPVGQCEWLQQQLAASVDYRHTFVFGHIPPEPQNNPSEMCLGQNDSRYLHEIVKQYQPTALFFGHLHRRVWFSIDSVPVYGVRSCNWNFGGEPIGFLQVSVFPQRLEIYFIET